MHSRHLLGITKLDKEKIQCIRQKTGAQNIVKEIKQYQKKWLQHVQRMDTDRLPKQALQYKPKGRRNIERQRKRWRDQLHLEDQGIGNTPNPSGTWWWWWRQMHSVDRMKYSLMLNLAEHKVTTGVWNVKYVTWKNLIWDDALRSDKYVKSSLKTRKLQKDYFFGALVRVYNMVHSFEAYGISTPCNWVWRSRDRASW